MLPLPANDQDHGDRGVECEFNTDRAEVSRASDCSASVFIPSTWVHKIGNVVFADERIPFGLGFRIIVEYQIPIMISKNNLLYLFVYTVNS